MAVTAPVITYSRLRMTTDGEGVTTLVIFHDCPLRCKYCLNPFSFAPDTKREDLTPEQLYDKVKIDDLYFVATGGGVTFGGGEPLYVDGVMVGALGVSGGTAEQDTKLGEYGKNKLKDVITWN